MCHYAQVFIGRDGVLFAWASLNLQASRSQQVAGHGATMPSQGSIF
jgi:hypothetical protein